MVEALNFHEWWSQYNETHNHEIGGKEWLAAFAAWQYSEILTKQKYSIRQAAKDIKFILHEQGCQHPKTATCTCGREPFYSPVERRKRGEIE